MAERRTKIQRAEKVQAALYQISESAHTSEDLNELYCLIHAVIAELMPANNFYIALYDESSDLISFPYYVDEFDAAPMPVKPGRGLTEYVLSSGQPLLATPEVFDQLTDEGKIESRGAPSFDWLGVPLKIQKKIIGIMVVQSYTLQVRYTPADQDVLVFVSTQVAMAIERKRAERALRKSEEQYRLLFEKAPIGICLVNMQGQVVGVNPKALLLLGSPSVEASTAVNIYDLQPLVEMGFIDEVQHCIQTSQSLVGERPYTSKWGRSAYIQYYMAPITDADGQVTLVQILLEDITERKKAEEKICKLNRMLQVTSHVNQVLIRAVQEKELMQSVCQILIGIGGYQLAWIGLIDPNDEGKVIPTASAGHKPRSTDGFDITWEKPEQVNEITGEAILTDRPVLVRDIQSSSNHLEWREQALARGYASSISLPLSCQSQAFGAIIVYAPQMEAFDDEEIELLSQMAGDLAYGILSLKERVERERAEEEIMRLNQDLQRRAGELSILNQVSRIMASTLELDTLLDLVIEQTRHTLEVEAALVALCEPVAGDESAENDETVDLVFTAVSGVDSKKMIGERLPISTGIAGWVVREKQSALVANPISDPRYHKHVDGITGITPRTLLVVPLIARGRVLGVVEAVNKKNSVFNDHDRAVLEALCSSAAIALENARLYRSALDAADRRTTLYWLSQEIVRTNLEPQGIYNTIHQATLKLMPADTFVVSLLDENTNEIEMAYSMEHGKPHPGKRIPKSRGLSGRIIATGDSVIIGDIEQESRHLDLVRFGDPPRIRSILAVPMRLGGKVLGMVSAQSYKPHAFTEEDSDLLEILAAYAAVALENARLFNQMQESNIQLSQAYEATIEGWSRALEMRDKETKGHSERVTRLSLRLARVVGLPECEFTNLRRGVLLHDIGKMVVPDHILLKPGPLSEDEQAIMRQHPIYGYEMLSSIPFLAQALDIPYCHHENWDGTGYPRGLKGEDIPFGARIFALVDVWDALLSNRPYRPGWTVTAARNYIVEQSGRRFDPNVVIAFLNLLDGGELLGDV